MTMALAAVTAGRRSKSDQPVGQPEGGRHGKSQPATGGSDCDRGGPAPCVRGFSQPRQAHSVWRRRQRYRCRVRQQQTARQDSGQNPSSHPWSWTQFPRAAIRGPPAAGPQIGIDLGKAKNDVKEQEDDHRSADADQQRGIGRGGDDLRPQVVRLAVKPARQRSRRRRAYRSRSDTRTGPAAVRERRRRTAPWPPSAAVSHHPNPGDFADDRVGWSVLIFGQVASASWGIPARRRSATDRRKSPGESASRLNSLGRRLSTLDAVRRQLASCGGGIDSIDGAFAEGTIRFEDTGR